MTCKQLAAHKVLLVACGSHASGAVNGLSQRWAKGWRIHHWLFLSLFSLALMCLFLSTGPSTTALSLCYYHLFISISVTLLSLFPHHSWLPVSLSLSPFFILHFPTGLFYNSLFLFSRLLYTPFPSLPPEQATTGHISVGLIGYDKGDKRLWDGIALPGP